MRDYSDNRPARWLRTACFVVGCAAISGIASAQTAPAQPLTLLDAVELARKNYPSGKEIRARAEAAEQGIGLARTSYLPRLDLLWQGNRATRNNVFGLLLPQGVVAPISGPEPGNRFRRELLRERDG